jgi:hypothetical protein
MTQHKVMSMLVGSLLKRGIKRSSGFSFFNSEMPSKHTKMAPKRTLSQLQNEVLPCEV